MMYIVAILAFLAIGLVNAQSDDKQMFRHPLTDMPAASEDIETSHYFPLHPDNKFPSGETLTVLCHFRNEGSGVYNVSAIMGSLNSPVDFRHHYQNYSYKPVGQIVKSGEEISLQYAVQIHQDLEPVEYQLAITVFYESESESFSTTFFNQTVELYSPVSEYDFETIVSVLMSLVFATCVVIVSYIGMSPDTKFAFLDFGKKQVVTPVQSDTDEDSWIPVEPKKKNRGKKQE